MVEADLAEVAGLGEQFHSQAGWSDIFAYNRDDCERSLAAFLGSPACILLVAEEDGEITGMAAGILSPVYFNHSHLSGEELFWWVSERASQLTGMRLLNALEAEAKERGCSSFQMKSIDRLNGERMAKLYARKGYRASEHSFIKRI